MPTVQELKLIYPLVDFELLKENQHYDPLLKISFNKKCVKITYTEHIECMNSNEFNEAIMKPAINAIMSK